MTLLPYVSIAPVPCAVHLKPHDGVKVATVVRVDLAMRPTERIDIPCEVSLNDEVAFGFVFVCEQRRVADSERDEECKPNGQASPEDESDDGTGEVVNGWVCLISSHVVKLHRCSSDVKHLLETQGVSNPPCPKPPTELLSN